MECYFSMKMPTNLSWDQNLAKKKEFKTKKLKRSLIWKVNILFSLHIFINLFVLREYFFLGRIPWDRKHASLSKEDQALKPNPSYRSYLSEVMSKIWTSGLLRRVSHLFRILFQWIYQWRSCWVNWFGKETIEELLEREYHSNNAHVEVKVPQLDPLLFVYPILSS